MADRLSIGTVWEDAAAFCRREAGLLLPVAAIGFGLPFVVLLLAVPADQAETGKIVAGWWMLWLLPCGLLSMTGSLAISALALRPGASVGECLRVAVARLPAGIGLFALHVAFQTAIALPTWLLAVIEVRGRGAAGPLTLLAEIAAMAATIWVFVRVMPVWALLSARPLGPVATVRAVFALTRGRYRPLLLVRVVGAMAGVVAMLVTLVPLGAVFAMIGMATGGAQAAEALSYVACAAVFAALAAVWTVTVARLYARLAAGSIRGM